MINFTGANGRGPRCRTLSTLALATLSLLGLWPILGGEATPIDSHRRIACCDCLQLNVVGPPSHHLQNNNSGDSYCGWHRQLHDLLKRGIQNGSVDGDQ